MDNTNHAFVNNAIEQVKNNLVDPQEESSFLICLRRPSTSSKFLNDGNDAFAIYVQG